MTMLVVGGAGFLGSTVAALAARERDPDTDGEVHALVRTPGGSRPAGAPTSPGLRAIGGSRPGDAAADAGARPAGRVNDGVTVHVGDARAPDLGLPQDEAEALVDEVSQIVVTTGRVDLSTSLTAARQEHLLPLLGALQFARRCPKLETLVYVSSIVAVGEVGYPARSGEVPVQPRLRNFYEWVKLEGENLVRSSDLPVRIVRPGHVLDAQDGSQQAHAAQGILEALPYVTAGWPVPVLTSARYWCAPVDFVAQVVLALARPSCPVTAAWAVDPASPTLGELLDMLAFRHGLRVRPLRPGRAARGWLGLLARRVWSDPPTHLAPYLDTGVDLDLRCLDQLVARGDVEVPAGRDYVCRTVDHFVERLRRLA